MQELIVAVQKRFEFEEQTMEYLVGYRYAKALLFVFQYFLKALFLPKSGQQGRF